MADQIHITTKQMAALVAVHGRQVGDGWVTLTTNGHWCNDGSLRVHALTVRALVRKGLLELVDFEARVTAAGLAQLPRAT